MRALTLMLLLLVHAVPMSAEASSDAQPPRTSMFNDQWLKFVVSIELYREERDPKAIGTGFLVLSPCHTPMLFTAAHVVRQDNGKPTENLAYRFNLPPTSDMHSALVRDEWQTDRGMGGWFFSDDDDLACRFVAPGSLSDVAAVTRSRFLYGTEVAVGARAAILGFPLGLRSTGYATPIFREATISRVDSTLIIVDGFAFPGNSGSPVIYVPPHRLDIDMDPPLLQEQRLVGIVKREISFQDRAISEQSKVPRAVFVDNTGLTEVIPVARLAELMARPDVRDLDLKIEQRVRETGSQLSN